MEDDNPFRCWVCGAVIYGSRDHILASGRSVPQTLAWRTRCSIEDFNKIVFTNKEVWGTFIRAIIVTLDENRHDVYQLSGIAQNTYCIRIIVPKDRNLAVLGYPRLGGRGCKFVGIEPTVNAVGYPRAHMIHARCWELIERLFGCEAEKNLKILLNIFQERWCGWKGNPDGSPRYDFLREDILWQRNKSIVFYDPVKILPLRAVVEESVQRPTREKVAYKAMELHPIFFDIKNTAISNIFPCEIQWMIMDLLDYKNIPKILRAFGWVLSDIYWSRRFPKDLVFEVDDLMSNQIEIDWQFLTLGVEKLLHRSPELLNRRRLLTVLKKARDLFFEEVAKSTASE